MHPALRKGPLFLQKNTHPPISFSAYGPGTRFTKYLTTILRLSYDNAKVTIDLRRTSNLQNILRRAQGFSYVRFTCKVVRSSETVFANYLAIFLDEILALFKSLS